MSSVPLDIILVEDDLDDIFFFKLAIHKTAMLPLLSYAKNSDQLFQVLQTRTPDIIFLDVLMAGQDGMNVITKIRSDHNYDRIILVVFSSLYWNEKVHETHERGADFFLMKEPTINGLTEKLQRLFAYDRQRQPTSVEIERYVL